MARELFSRYRFSDMVILGLATCEGTSPVPYTIHPMVAKRGSPYSLDVLWDTADDTSVLAQRGVERWALRYQARTHENICMLPRSCPYTPDCCYYIGPDTRIPQMVTCQEANKRFLRFAVDCRAHGDACYREGRWQDALCAYVAVAEVTQEIADLVRLLFVETMFVRRAMVVRRLKTHGDDYWIDDQCRTVDSAIRRAR